jgi:hypothetical protein
MSEQNTSTTQSDLQFNLFLECRKLMRINKALAKRLETLASEDKHLRSRMETLPAALNRAIRSSPKKKRVRRLAS